MPAAVPHDRSIPDRPVRAAGQSAPAQFKTSAATELTVVIVNFCQWKNTARLVRQLRHSEAVKGGSAQIVVVDNRSPYHPAEAKLAKYRGVTIAPSLRNVGFAAGVNLGARQTAGDSTSESWILLLNPDVTVADGFLDDALLAAEKLIRSQPKVGVIGLKLQNRDGTPQPSCGPWPTLANTVFGTLAPRWRRKCKPLDAVEPVRVPWATGGCLLVRRHCFEALGGFNDDYFLYYEDVDFCRRATAAGFEVWYDPAASATHHWPLHSRPVPAPLRLITRHALLTYARTHWSRPGAWLLGRFIRLEARLRAAWATRQGNAVAAEFYRHLLVIVREAECGRTAEVRKIMDAAAEHLVAVASAQDGRTA